MTFANPLGKITNSDLELAGGLLHLDAVARSFDTRERTLLSKNGSTTAPPNSFASLESTRDSTDMYPDMITYLDLQIRLLTTHLAYLN